MGVHDVVDVAGQTQRKFGHGNQQGVAAAGSGSLDVHGGAAGRLAQRTTHVLTAFAETLHQSTGSGALAFPERGGGDGSDFDVLSVRFVLKPVDDFQKIKLGQSTHGQDFIFFQSQFFAPLFGSGHVFFRCFRNLPIGHLYCIVRHCNILLSIGLW